MVAVAGEASIDLVQVDERLYDAVPGGSSANVAIGLSRLGVPSACWSGLAAIPSVAANGVDLSSNADASDPTTIAVVSVGSELADLLDEAVCASAVTCTRRGADLPWREEIASWSDERPSRKSMALGDSTQEAKR